MNAHDRSIIVHALAFNADEKDADVVLSQALDGLRAEAETISLALTEGADITTALCSHTYRLKAVESLFDSYMEATWQQGLEDAE